MAYDPQKRDLPTLQADFVRDTEDACSDLQYGTEYRLNHGLEYDHVTSAFANLFVAYRKIVRDALLSSGCYQGDHVSARLLDRARTFYETCYELHDPEAGA